MDQQQADVILLAWGLATSMPYAGNLHRKMIERAEELVLTIPDYCASPQLERWMAARANPACDRCVKLAQRSKQHRECRIKIKEWFAAREALREWVARGVKDA